MTRAALIFVLAAASRLAAQADEDVLRGIDALADEYAGIAQTIWDYAEVGYLETGVQVHSARASLVYLDVVPRDTDGDGIPDGIDNCPFVPNEFQENADPLPAGDACQCGDVNTDFIVDDLDAQIARENLVGSALSGSFDPDRCNVIGTSDCGVDDIFVLDRVAKGLPVTLQNICDAYSGP